MAPPINEISNRGDEPKDGVCQDYPDRVLHSLDIRIALRVLADVHLSGAC